LQGTDFLLLRTQALHIQPVDHAYALRVVGNGDIGIAACACPFDHLAQAQTAIAGGGVHVQITADVAQSSRNSGGIQGKPSVA